MALKRYIPLLLLILAPFAGRAQEVDVNKIVMEHLADSYEWHICTVGERHVSIPLPVIAWGNDGKWYVFSSSHLHHGLHSYKGFSIAHEGDHAGKLVDMNGKRPKLDISITKNVLALLINCTILLLLVVPLARWYKRGNKVSPKGFPGMMEITIEYINEELIIPCVGPEHRKYAPFLLTVFFFILVTNLMGLIPFFPGGANLTGNIAVTMVLALSTFLVVNLSGTKEYWKEIFWPEVPAWLKVPAPIMPAIELFGVFTKPFALMVRLFANLFAGHVAILGLVCLIFMTVSMGPALNAGMTVISVLFSIFMLVLELLVAFIQAYVFTLLSGVFIGMARVKHETNNH